MADSNRGRQRGSPLRRQFRKTQPPVQVSIEVNKPPQNSDENLEAQVQAKQEPATQQPPAQPAAPAPGQSVYDQGGTEDSKVPGQTKAGSESGDETGNSATQTQEGSTEEGNPAGTGAPGQSTNTGGQNEDSESPGEQSDADEPSTDTESDSEEGEPEAGSGDGTEDNSDQNDSAAKEDEQPANQPQTAAAPGEPVYKTRGSDPSNTAGEPTDKDKSDGSPDKKELNKKEGSAETKSETSVTEGADDKEKSLYSPSLSKTAAKMAVGRKGFFVFNNTRKIFGGGIIGVIIGLFLLFTLTSGPLQDIHLAKILGTNFAGDQNTSSIRLNGLFRYARSGNIGETRVSLVGSKVFGHTIDQLKAAGIEFNTNAGGYVTSATLDTGKLQNSFPEMKNMTEAEQRSFLADKFNLDEGQLVKISGLNGPKFAVNTRDFGVKATRALISDSQDAVLDDGKVVSSIKLRVISDYYDVPSIFHPYQRLKANTFKKLSVNAQRAAEQKAQEEETASVVDSVENAPESLAVRARVKNALSENQSVVAGALVAQAGLCFVRSVADDAVSLNRTAIVLPSTLESASAIAKGSQVQSNQDFAASQVSTTNDSFTDASGATIWDAEALQATAGATQPGGTDLPTEYAQAFSGNTTADGIRKYVTLKIHGVDVTGVLCSAPFLVVGGLVGVAAVLFAAPSGGSSFATYVALKGAEAGGTAGIVYLLQKQLTPLIKDQAIIPKVFSGPLGGNLLAYGARELGNINAIASGGIDLANTATSTISPALQNQENQQFNSESTYAKLFDAKDYRSVAGRLIDNTSPSFSQNIAKMGSALFHFGSIATSFSRLISPKAAAAAQPYDWGFDRYGIPDSIASDPNFADPYANADYVAKNILDSGDSGSYISRAKSCFGVNINNQDSDNDWQVVPSGDVNPGSSDYTGANCNDNSDNWHRLMLFVFDSRTMDAAACFDGSDSDPETAESCANSGYANTATSTTTAAVPTTTTATGITVNNPAAQAVAKQSGANVGYALYNSSGQSLAEYNSTNENYSASITKAMILVAYLNQLGDGKLGSAASADLTAMIELSDDGAANKSYGLLNNPAAELNAVAKQAGMTGFKLDTDGDSLYYLGQSQITAQDFAKFFSKIDTMFPASQKTFALNLLSNISGPSGLLQAGLPGTVYSKEGWKPEPGGGVDPPRIAGANVNPFGVEGTPYIVNQAAQFSAGGTTYGIAVTVGGTSTRAAGDAIIQKVVAALVQAQ